MTKPPDLVRGLQVRGLHDVKLTTPTLPDPEDMMHWMAHRLRCAAELWIRPRTTTAT